MSREVMKQAMTALEHAADWLDEHQSAYDEAINAIEALRAELDAPERDIGRTLDQFLCNGTRIKLNFNRIGNMTSLQNMAHDLQGRWVALVPAENDCHLKRNEYVPLSDERIIDIAINLKRPSPHECTPVFLTGSNLGYRRFRSAGDHAHVNANDLVLFARAIEQEVRAK